MSGSSSSRAARASSGGVGLYSDLAECLGSERLDFVDIATPPSEHLEGVERAAGAGLHVLVEKPLCLDAADFNAIAALGERSLASLSGGERQRASIAAALAQGGEGLGLAAQENGPTYAHQSGPAICAVDCWVERSVEGRDWLGGRTDQVS